MDEQQPDERKLTAEQEANLQRHLRHQARTRRKEGQPATTIAKVAGGGCGGVLVLILSAVAGVLYVIFKFLMAISGSGH